jgi:hypothetical protein
MLIDSVLVGDEGRLVRGASAMRPVSPDADWDDASRLLACCSSAFVLVPLYFAGRPVWRKLLDAPASVTSLSEALQMRSGPVSVLFRTARIVFEHKYRAAGEPTLALSRAHFPDVSDVLWKFWLLDLSAVLRSSEPELSLLEAVLKESAALLALESCFATAVGTLVLGRVLHAFRELRLPIMNDEFNFASFMGQCVPSPKMRVWCSRVLS